MICPDLSALARAGTPRGDPAVEEHLHSCDSCWLDWQIQQGARCLAISGGKAPHDPRDLNEQVLTRIALIASQSEGPSGWKQLALSGLLIAVSVLIFLATRMEFTGALPFGQVVIVAIVSGIAGGYYCWLEEGKADGLARQWSGSPKWRGSRTEPSG